MDGLLANMARGKKKATKEVSSKGGAGWLCGQMADHNGKSYLSLSFSMF